jgi:putative membrane-bound dehydrogenase-like protein
MLQRLPVLFIAICLISSSLSAQEKKAGPGDVVLPPEVQLKTFHLPEGFEVELIAAEPAIINPITMALDEKGRLYVTEGHTYRYGPKGSPVANPTNPIVRLDPAPDGKGWKRTIVAEGFEDPVMGLLIRDGKMWCTSCEHIYVYDIDDAGKTSNRKEILHDNSKAWNPFGFFVLEWGPEDLMYVSVGNHNMQIVGPTNEMKSRGNSGIIMRMKPDGSNMEKLVEGLRVPYSFEFDPFGQLWVLSNGQGNPDRFVKVIAGIDYHCYSRPKVGNKWLAGEHPLAPPCFETVNGARTQLLHYYAAAFPDSYQGRQFGVNWGPHGVGTRNHAIEEFVPDARERNIRTGNWLTSGDPRFRPTQLMLAPDGNLLVADWYGRDDENDLTGRIWKIKYTGKDAPKVTRLSEADWKDDAKVLEALGSRDHLERERAIRALATKGEIKKIAEQAATSKNALAAANALWVLARIGTPEAKAAFGEGAKNSDWKVRRLALRLLKRYEVPKADAVAKGLLKDPDPAVRLEAVLLQGESSVIHDGLVSLLRSDAALDPHLRYEAAYHLARHARGETWSDLASSDGPETRLAGLIALDVALYEQFPAKDLAKKNLSDFLAAPGKLDVNLLLDLAMLHPDSAMIPAVQKLLEQPKLAPATIAEASKLLRTLAGANKGVKNPWLELLKSGKVPLTSPEDKQTVLMLLPDEGPTTFGVELLGKLIADGDAKKVVLPAAAVARAWEGKAVALTDQVWKQLNNPKLALDVRIELAGTLAAIDPKPDVKRWQELLKSAEPALAREIVRDFRRFLKDKTFSDALAAQMAELVKRDPALKHDLALSLSILGETSPRPDLGPAAFDLKEYRDFGVKNFTARPSPEQLALGRMTFERANCAKCHLLDANEKIGPTLGGVGRHELNHVIESILEPSKIILTGYEVERIETQSGVVYTGIVREKGNELTIINAEKTEKLPKSKVAERVLLKTSIMPDDILKSVSREEFADLLAFLMTQKANVGPVPPKKKK